MRGEITGVHGALHGDRNRSERAGIGEARSAGTGVYMAVYEDAEHRATADGGSRSRFMPLCIIGFIHAKQGRDKIFRDEWP